MTSQQDRFLQMLKEDPRYQADAYFFVRYALSYAQEVAQKEAGLPESEPPEFDPDESSEEAIPEERHLTGQQLCEAIRQYALEQYGYIAKIVLNNWGINTTGDFGEIVYNLINIGDLKKSANDSRDDFNDVYDFDEAFRQQFQITMPD